MEIKSQKIKKRMYFGFFVFVNILYLGTDNRNQVQLDNRRCRSAESSISLSVVSTDPDLSVLPIVLPLFTQRCFHASSRMT